MSLNEMRDLIYADAVKHGLWEGVEKATDYEVRSRVRADRGRGAGGHGRSIRSRPLRGGAGGCGDYLPLRGRQAGD